MLDSLLANSHGSVQRRRRKSLPATRKTSTSSDKTQKAKDEENEFLPDVEEGNEGRHDHGGAEEGTKIGERGVTSQGDTRRIFCKVGGGGGLPWRPSNPDHV